MDFYEIFLDQISNIYLKTLGLGTSIVLTAKALKWIIIERKNNAKQTSRDMYEKRNDSKRL